MRALQRFGVFSTALSLAVSALLGADYRRAYAEVLLEIRGTLTEQDKTLEDGSLYDEYLFEGSGGQQVTISLESQDFDPYLILIDPDGRRISENDDISRSNRNSQLRMILPVTGTYRAVANSYESEKSGAYRIRIDQGNYQSSTPEALALAIPSSSTICDSKLVSTVGELVSDRDLGVVVSALQLNTLYEEILSARPYGLNFALSGPAAASVLASPQVLNTATIELIRNCDTLGAVVFGSTEAEEEKIFGYLPALAESSSETSDMPVGEFACTAPPEKISPTDTTPMPKPQWGEQFCL